MRKCDEGDQHSLIVIHWAVTEKSRQAKLFMCQHCLRLFDYEKISQRDSRLDGDHFNE